jgi:CheY-like chemotaxis protein
MAKILIVDDDPGTVEVLRRIFTRNGYEVLVASNGKACLEKVETEKPDLVFLDIIMPGIDGWEVCRRIKENPSTRRIQVSMLSTRKSAEDMRRSFEYAHADEHLGKPINFDEVLKTADALLESEQWMPARPPEMGVRGNCSLN